MKYKCKIDLEILSKIFLKDEYIFITDSYYCMDGRFDYARKVFDSERNYLGRIRDSYFYSNYKHKLEKE